MLILWHIIYIVSYVEIEIRYIKTVTPPRSVQSIAGNAKAKFGDACPHAGEQVPKLDNTIFHVGIRMFMY